MTDLVERLSGYITDYDGCRMHDDEEIRLPTPHCSFFREIIETITTLRAKLEAAERDAGRYRWAVAYGSASDTPEDDDAWDALMGPYNKDYIDAAIDAAIAAAMKGANC